jgi:hypothetical protein
MKKSTRNWCAEYQFDGFKPFLLGTVYLPGDAMQHEIEEAALNLLKII